MNWEIFKGIWKITAFLNTVDEYEYHIFNKRIRGFKLTYEIFRNKLNSRWRH